MSDIASADVKHEEGRIVERAIEDEMRESFLDYSMSVIVARALPDARDGLKPVQRRILHAMGEIGLWPSRPFKKSAAVVGEVLAKYHPHGDSAVYDTLVRLAQDFAMAEPLVDGQGNFGSIDGDPAAAYRYTEARLTAAAAEMLADIDRDTVDFAPTFDDAHQEPVVLPARLPNLLLNGQMGIAVGMATSIPPFNLREICRAIALLCDTPEVDDESLYSLIQGPDFPTGGLVLRTRKGIHGFLRHGEGKMSMRAKVHVERELGGRTSLVVTEIPYGVVKSTIVEQIANLVREKKTETISDLRDESDRDGIRIVITLKRDADPAEVLEVLFAQTHLQKTFGGKLLALVDGKPVVLSVRQALEVFLEHRLVVVVRRAQHDLGVARRRHHIVEGLLIAIDAIDRVVEIIKGSSSRDVARDALTREFGLSREQADAILNLRLSGLTALDVTQLRDELAALLQTIASLEALLADPARQRALVRSETEELALRYGRDRRTQIVTEEQAMEIARQAADEQAQVHLTATGRIWARPVGARSRSRATDSADPVLRTLIARASDTLCIVSDLGRYYPLSVADLLVAGGAARTLAHVIEGVSRSERVLWAGPVRELDASKSLCFVTRDGQIKRTVASEYAHPRSGGVQAVGVREGDELLSVFLSGADGDEIVLVSREGQAIRFGASEVPVQGRTASGVRGVRLRDGDQVVSASLMGPEVAFITKAGYAKRVQAEEFPLQGRGGMGVKCFRSMDRVGGSVVWAQASPFTPALWVRAGSEGEWRVLRPDALAPSVRASHGNIPSALELQGEIGEVWAVPEELASRVLRNAEEATALEGDFDEGAGAEGPAMESVDS